MKNLKDGVLLEAGFDDVAPNEPRDMSSLQRRGISARRLRYLPLRIAMPETRRKLADR